MRLSFSHPIRINSLGPRKPTRFDFKPDGEELADLAAAVGASSLSGVHFRGEIRPLGREDWVLEGHLTAEVVQPCIVTLDPVTTHISEDVERRYLANPPELPAEEAEIPEDTDAEPLGSTIDPGAVMAEALALAMPLYPRAEGVEVGEQVFTEPGVAPMRDGDVKPFASLAELREKLAKKD